MNKKALSFIFLTSALLVSLAVTSVAYPGIGSFGSAGTCNACHMNVLGNANMVNGTLLDLSALVIDGHDTDDVWDSQAGDETIGRRHYIDTRDFDHGETEFVKVIWAQNSTHLAGIFRVPILNQISTGGTGSFDGLSICFNIDMVDFDVDYTFMRVSEPGKMVDVMTWKLATASSGINFTSNSSTGIVNGVASNDTAVTFTGWNRYMSDAGFHTDATAMPWTWASTAHYAHGHWSYYIEAIRPLVTDAMGDTSFDESKIYNYAVAWFNGTNAASHHVSFEQGIYVAAGTALPQPGTTTPTGTSTDTCPEPEPAAPGIPGYSAPILFGIAAVAVVAIKKRRS